jgi:Kef-type K+ transport system membrane component KefB
MFIAGIETDVAGVMRVGKVAFWSAAGGVVLPMGIGAWASRYFGYPWKESIFIGTILTATSVSITAQTLLELNALKSKEGSCILGAAVIDDVMGIIVLSLVVAFSLNPIGQRGINTGFIAIIFLITQLVVFFVLSILIGQRYFEKIINWASKIPASQMVLATSLILCFLYAFWAEYFGKVAAITGAYIAGVLLSRTSFKEQILKESRIFSYPLFVPIFLIDIGLQANARQLTSEITFTFIIIIIAILGKIFGCGLGAKLTGFNFMESTRVGIGMISRGEVGLIVASYGLAHAVIGQDIFSSMVLMVLVTTLVTPILLRFVFPRQKFKTN